jgi:predicted RNA-binding protein YlqC (UPF0109 family)
MKEFLKFVVVQLVDRPEEIILRDEERGGVHRFTLELPQSEVGKVIGKMGGTIRAIRNLMSNAAARHGGRVTLEIVEK